MSETIYSEGAVRIETGDHPAGDRLIRFDVNGVAYDSVVDDSYGMVELIGGMTMLIGQLSRARAALILRESQDRRETP